MNPPLSEAAPVASSTPSTSVSHSIVEPPFQLRRIFLGLLLAVALADFCFWGANGMGFSVGVFFPVVALIILASRQKIAWTRTTILLYALMAGASLEAMIETGIANTIVLLALLVALSGESYYAGFESLAARSYAQLVALALAPGRVFWLGTRTAEKLLGDGRGRFRWLVAVGMLSIPAVVLALVFGSLLAAANPVFGSWANSFFGWFWNELVQFLDFERLAFWVFAAFLALPFIRPARIPITWWSWLPHLPRLQTGGISARGAIFSSALVLVVLNLVFLVANTADVMFLWSGAALPAGTDYKSYVHDGINTLIFTVILTAIVLTAIFQQDLKVAGSPLLKALGLVWIAQNLLLLANCALRLKHYIVDYELTIARESCLIFLVLVATGFVLLTVMIVRQRSLAWLIGGCLLATFVTFYVTQFLNLYGWSADYNVSRYQQTHFLDTEKLYEAGPAAWPAARRAYAMNPEFTVLNVESGRGPVTSDDAVLAQFDAKHWREFSLRAYWNRWALDDKK